MILAVLHSPNLLCERSSNRCGVSSVRHLRETDARDRRMNLTAQAANLVSIRNVETTTSWYVYKLNA